MNQSKSFCEAISKYLQLLKQEVWIVQQQRRSIVMFLSNDYQISLLDALPGQTSVNKCQRLALANIFRKRGLSVKRNIVSLSKTFERSCAAVVLCVDENLHNEARKVTQDRLQKFGLEVTHFWEENDTSFS